MDEFERARQRMVDGQLAGRDIHDSRVLEAFRKVPRHLFVDEVDRGHAYEDYPLPVGCGQTISQPYMVALMTQCLQLRGSEAVLEIGTGSGYQTAILAELASRVYTIERIPELSQRARTLLEQLGYGNIEYKVGDGTLGWPDHAPFDAILVTAGAPQMPKALTEQLAAEGRLVIPVGGRSSQMLQVAWSHLGRPRVMDVCACVFVKLIGEQGWAVGE